MEVRTCKFGVCGKMLTLLFVFTFPKSGLKPLTFITLFPGAEKFSRDIELMLGRGVPVFLRICWCFLTPAVLLVRTIILLNFHL